MQRWWYFPSVAAFTVLLLGMCRLVFFYVNNHELIHDPPVQAMLIGLKFDISVISYWLAPIFLIHFGYALTGKHLPRVLRIISSIYLLSGFFLIVLIAVADISYYKFYYAHIGSSALNWTANPGEVVQMLWGESIFRWSILGVIFAFAAFGFLHFFMARYEGKKAGNNYPKLAVYFALTTCFFLAMRGGLRAKPLNIKDSWYSEHHFFNQLALSPVYNFYEQTVAGDRLHKRMSSEEKTRFLNYRSKNKNLKSFVFGFPKPTSKPNVVFILMEGMASHKLRNAPFLDSITRRSIYFDSFFSTGEHTYNGVFSSLWGEPAVMGRHMLRWMENKPLQGLPYLFRKAGYHTIFQIPHSRSFDNMGSFLWKHHFDTITDAGQMPVKYKSACIWGTSDHLYLEYVVHNLNYLTSKGKPVFSVALTVSDHTPYFFPDAWPYQIRKSRAENATLYADWSLRRFFELASGSAWFQNTIFVLVADHGQHQEKTDYPLPLGLHHIPFLIYSPGLGIQPMVLHRLGAQTDILPTLSDMLNLGSTANLVGFDLFQEIRPWVILSSDAYYGLLDQEGYSVIDEYGNTLHYPATNTLFTEQEEKERQQSLLQNVWFIHDRVNSFGN